MPILDGTMCRMLIAIGETALGPLIDGLIGMAENKYSLHELNKKKGIGSLKHSDGWGIAYVQKEKWKIVKSVKPVYDDPEINNLRKIKTPLAILHARKAAGSGISLQNTHPCYIRCNGKEYVFCHNGYLREKISFDSKFKLQGQTDSEKLLYSILSELPEKSIIKAIQSNLQKYKKNRGTNIIIATHKHSYISLRENTWPLYYQMYLGKRPGLIIVSSEVLPQLKDMNWAPISVRETIVINNKTQHITKHSY